MVGGEGGRPVGATVAVGVFEGAVGFPEAVARADVDAAEQLFPSGGVEVACLVEVGGIENAGHAFAEVRTPKEVC